MMKKLALILFLAGINWGLFAQRQAIDIDIFGDLTYRSNDGGYRATLKKNIFDDLVFKDNQRNEITYEKKYLVNQYPGILSNNNQKRTIFLDLIRENRRSEDYKAKYKIDILDRLIIEDNQGYKLEEKKDIFGSIERNETINGQNIRVRRTFGDAYEYTKGLDRATLKKGIANKRIYEDSFGNKLEFAAETWKRLVDRYDSEEDAFIFLIDQYFVQ
ncbi:hypothetical protein [Sphingobacterium corticibacter]|uniref:Uncharacterized protein n=1 Tax=Sphingobacterium corticibacter TaxID=2171749 RepID=A0A2T8HIE3_9SPHI|nr:hypothetical protein [Sphingobacterium corticibacter]PVH25204.1 hypothetical protein DC487_09775 [Sphingobacterium corticibacter]